MSDANKIQIGEFKRQYCTNSNARLTINDDFIVEVLSYEELLPGNTIRSYATGNRRINNAFIIFKVTDTYNDIIYYPVFSETVGRQLVSKWGLKLPKKMAVFTHKVNGYGGGNPRAGHLIKRKDENEKMLRLINFARSMMILHEDEPKPMNGPFQKIYAKLESHPEYDVFEQDIKSVNTAILHFISKSANIEKFTNLQQYIVYLQARYPQLNLIDFDFNLLRDKMMKKYPNEKIAF